MNSFEHELIIHGIIDFMYIRSGYVLSRNCIISPIMILGQKLETINEVTNVKAQENVGAKIIVSNICMYGQ